MIEAFDSAAHGLTSFNLHDVFPRSDRKCADGSPKQPDGAMRYATALRIFWGRSSETSANAVQQKARRFVSTTRKDCGGTATAK
jgi:hypothetical protein